MNITLVQGFALMVTIVVTAGLTATSAIYFAKRIDSRQHPHGTPRRS